MASETIPESWRPVLEPVLAAEVRARALAGAMREDVPPYGSDWTASSWVAIARDSDQLAALGQKAPAMAWRQRTCVFGT